MTIEIEALNQSSIECPQCSSGKIWKDGIRKSSQRLIQRYLCRDCGYRFSLGQTSNKSETSTKSRVCDILEESKNLAVATEPRATGDISKQKNKLFNYAWHLQKQGLQDPTIKTYVKLVKILDKRGANLSDPESVKGVLAHQKWVNKHKQNAVNAYTHYLEMLEIQWNPPYYREQEKPIFIPKESEIDSLISVTGLKTSVFLQCLKETGARAGEIQSLQWSDIDFESNIIRITPEKGSRPRTLKVSTSLIQRLGHVKTVNRVKNLDNIFGRYYKSILRVYCYQRKNIARKLGNERLMKIKFHTLRHWHATKLYHETKDILFVQRRLGHKSLTNTMKYVHLAETYFGTEEDEYIVKVAENIEQALPLIEAGYVEASDFNGVKIFKIPKSRMVGVS